MSFHTQRPKSTDEMIQALLNKKNTRMQNLKALSENASIEKKAMGAQSVLESTHVQQQQETAVQERLNQIRQRRSRQIAAQNSTVGRMTLLEQAKTTVMNKVLFEMVYDAYWLDNDVKATTIQESYDTYKETVGIVEQLCGRSKVQGQNKSRFMVAVEEAVSETCEKAVDRILEEVSETGEDKINFNLNAEEESELDTKLSELGRDEIVDLVKDKVLTVVQDERESGKEKAAILQELNNKDDDEPEEPEGTEDEPDSSTDDTGIEEGIANINESYEGIEEGAVLGAILTAAVLGTAIACTVLSVKDKIELKKALKVYESKCKPAIKMSDLKPALYELDKAHRPTDKELAGIKKFFNKDSKRAKVWKDAKGHVVCTAICYTTTDIGTGVAISGNGASPTVSVETTYNYSYHVDKKYKKDELYLSAYMAFTDSFDNKNTQAFVIDMKKSFSDEMKNTKVKFFGKSLESTGVCERISPNFVEYESAQELMEECGLTGTGPEMTRAFAMNETDPERAIKLFSEYKDILQQGYTNILIAPADKYTHKVKTAVCGAVAKENEFCDTKIKELTKKMEDPVVKSTEEIMESIRMQNIRRKMNRGGASTLFESFMVSNLKKTTDAAVTEGVSLEKEDTMNASLIESILQYTVLETLNTLQIYKFTTEDVNRLKARNVSSIR